MPTISEHDALPAGTRLGEFEIQKILGIGGFGMVYLAMDHALQRLVAIKEYMPAALAGRGPDNDVVVRSASGAETFNLGLRSFINEARLLARFDHPSLVKVYRFWEAHGTAYMVMPYYQGQTLLQVRHAMSGPPDEAWLRRLIMPLLGALECLHKENVFHRDIAPDNILLLDDESGPAKGRPVLLDLGAARKVIGDHSQTLTAIVKPSFAPIEQYAETVQIRQGPWTDLYALAAVVHFCITGRPPMPATARSVHDDLPTLRQMSSGLASGFDCHLSESFANAIDQALAVRPQDRPESIAAWREALSGIVSAPADARAQQHPHSHPQTVLVRQEGHETSPGHKAIEAQAYMTTIPAAGKLHAPPSWPPAPQGGDPLPVTMPLSPAPHRDEAHRAVAASAPGGVRHGLKWAFAALVLLGVIAVWWLQRTSHQARPQEASAPATQRVGAPKAALTPESRKADRQDAGSRTDARKPSGDAVAAGASEARTRRQAPQEAVALRKDDDRDVDAGDALNPRKACAGKSFIMLAICMKRHCARPDYTAHPECERMRQQEAAQRTNY
ncbi:MAG: protein kinase [Aquabacterium sp.]|uniref:serine/threonine protein kinase n=1 Tax=Aquabacterium sp. TaxID=1872578 RepID=UPI0025C2E766|nr:serine/threonine-protein kinase [Aquabacterium sp.]MBI3383702.1 protein kinase [Aquabacterium sp.]